LCPSLRLLCIIVGPGRVTVSGHFRPGAMIPMRAVTVGQGTRFRGSDSESSDLAQIWQSLCPSLRAHSSYEGRDRQARPGPKSSAKFGLSRNWSEGHVDYECELMINISRCDASSFSCRYDESVICKGFELKLFLPFLDFEKAERPNQNKVIFQKFELCCNCGSRHVPIACLRTFQPNLEYKDDNPMKFGRI
jgi:hypothetical protein